MYINLDYETYSATQVLFTSNVKRSQRFYSDALGLHVTNQGGCLTVNIAGKNLKVFPTSDEDMLADIGVVFQVANIREMYGQLRTCCNSFCQLETSQSGLMQFAVSDPDNNIIYFIEKPH